MIGILIFATFICVCSTEHFIRFQPHPNLSSSLVYELVSNDVTFDASHRQPVLVKIVNIDFHSKKPNLQFHCDIQRVDPLFAITEALFCKKKNLHSKEKCASVDDKSKWENSAFELMSANNQIGFSVILNLTKHSLTRPRNNLDGFYFCMLSNVQFSVTSRNIEIRDYDGYRNEIRLSSTPRVEEKVTFIEDIDSKQLPLYLHCNQNQRVTATAFPNWVINEMPEPFKWYVCRNPVDRVDCLRKVRNNAGTPLDQVFTYHKFVNGTVILLDIKVGESLGAGIVCVSDIDHHRVFSMYMKMKEETELPLTIVQSPRSADFMYLDNKFTNYTELVVREGENKETPFVIRVPYITNNIDKWSTQWNKEGSEIPKEFTSNAHRLIFPSPIRMSLEGSYTLHVANQNKIYASNYIYVRIVRPPTPLPDQKESKLINVVMDKRFTLNSMYNHLESQTILEINGFPIDLRTETSKVVGTNALIRRFPRLHGLLFNFGNRILSVHESILYYTVHLKDPLKRSKDSQSHSVTFVHSNEVGVVRTNYQINVLERPRVLRRLSDYNCDPCCSTKETHLFKCKIDSRYYENYGIRIQYVWKINGVNTQSMNSVFNMFDFVKSERDSLTIKVKERVDNEANTMFNDFLSKVHIACKVILSEESKGDATRIVYDSTNDKEIEQALEVFVKVC